MADHIDNIADETMLHDTPLEEELRTEQPAPTDEGELDVPEVVTALEWSEDEDEGDAPTDEEASTDGEPDEPAIEDAAAEAEADVEAAVEADVNPERDEPADEPAGEPSPEPEPTPPAEPSITATLRFPQPLPKEKPAAEEGADAPSDQTAPVDAPRLRDVGTIFTGWLRGLRKRTAHLLKHHKRITFAAVLAFVALAAVGIMVGLRATQTPPDNLITTDARARLAAPSYTASDYVTDEPLVLSSVDIKHKHASATRKDACDVDLAVTFSNGSMETTADATLTYVRSGDDWSCSAATTGNVSHRATAGVDPELVAEHLSTLMRSAGSSEQESELLADAYQGAQTQLVGENFDEDEQVDALTLHCSSGTSFMSRECDLTARFRFVPASGAWELAEARVSDGALEMGFQPLVGTWHGTFQSQQTKKGKCLAAKDAGLQVTITKTSVKADGTALIEGTLNGVAHLHKSAKNDASSRKGDQKLEDTPFAGTLQQTEQTDDLLALLTGTSSAQPEGDIVFACVTQDNVSGSVALTLRFGLPDDENGAAATLMSEYSYDTTFIGIFSYKETARYEDAFTLVKES